MLKSLILKINPVSLSVLSLFLCYFIFGLLKVLGLSPVESVVSQIVSILGKEVFFLLGIMEIVLGIGILIPKTRLLFSILIILHLLGVSFVSLFFPGFVFSDETVLTMEGQFVVKNLALIALSYYILWGKLKVFNSKGES